MIRHAGQLGDRTVLGGGSDTQVSGIVIRIEHCVLLIHGGDLLPQGSSTLATAITDREGNHLAGGGIHRDPHPVAVRFLAHLSTKVR